MTLTAEQTFTAINGLRAGLATFGGPYQAALVIAACVLTVAALLPTLDRWRGRLLAAFGVLLIGGEGVLIWFHYRLWQLAVVTDPQTGSIVGRVAVPLWVESEKLFVWAIIVTVLGMVMRRHRDELMPGTMLMAAVLGLGAALLGKPFTDPVPDFFGQYLGYLQASAMGGGSAMGAFQGMYGSMTYYYNAWYMWVHPPLLFLSYGAFALSFLSTLLMIGRRHSAYETTSYRWARFGYLPLTFGMLLGFPWAIIAWSDSSWWWSGKVNMSIMMWVLYTAHLHARLYLRRSGMWKAVAVLAVLSFIILVLTYVTTYVVPGAHSYALSVSDPVLAATGSLPGGAL